MVHEKVTLSYTAVQLGEIIAARHFTPSGQANPFAAKARDDPSIRMFAVRKTALVQIAGGSGCSPSRPDTHPVVQRASGADS